MSANNTAFLCWNHVKYINEKRENLSRLLYTLKGTMTTGYFVSALGKL